MTRITRILTVLLMLSGPALQPAAQTETGTERIQALMAEGQLQEALNLTNTALATEQDNVNYQFLKGLILIRLDQLEQAESVFVGITERHPELPEPYNNLAVIYAAMGDLDKARAALQEAINTHPSYATAHENIGDIYAKLASQAYNQALELDRENVTAKAKLSLINDLFSVPKPAPQSLAQAVTPPAEPEPAGNTAPEPPAPDQAQAPAGRAESAADSTGSETAEQEPGVDREALIKQVTETVSNWAEAWSRQDVEAYLGHYSEEFTPPAGLTRADWQRERRERLRGPRFIRLGIDNLQVELLGEEHAQATFVQKYQSDTYSDLVTKLLLFVKQGDRWLIVQEATK